jgi:hypothetical protein
MKTSQLRNLEEMLYVLHQLFKSGSLYLTSLLMFSLLLLMPWLMLLLAKYISIITTSLTIFTTASLSFH